jgi:pimeloyl-ACP methyl ester carboxylesterase
MALPCLWMLLLLPLLAMSGCSTEAARGIETEGETVVLLHGLGRGTRAMRFLEYRLEQAGYETFNIGYPSTRLPPEQIFRLLHEKIDRFCAHKRKVHFVAHSLGGVLVRGLLEEKKYSNLGRVVILGTPSRGSALADRLRDNRLYKVLAGPTGQQIGTGKEALPQRLPVPDYELGVIAGTHSINPIGSWILSGPDDGIVSVESTRVEGMTDFMLTPADHVMMRYSDEVADAVIRFLQTGSFEPPPAKTTP